MKVPLRWLEEQVGASLDPESLAERLTAAGLECEVERPSPFPDGMVTGRIVECDAHPNADRLRVCTVDVGGEERLSIVCGAPNARKGLVGAVARVGVDFGDGFVIARRKLRGELSEGMLCSEAELGMSTEAEGILLLPEETPVGIALEEALSRETVLVTEPTSNRGDWLSIEGVAREVAAVLGLTRPVPLSSPPDQPDAGGWLVQIEDTADCPRYAGRVVEGLKAGPSPDWMARRLRAAGIRPIMNLVDVTNYVLLETGHPLHAFDPSRLLGKQIGVRRAKPDEKMTTLDGKDRSLNPDMLVIADEGGPIALAGVMGGEGSMATSDSTALLLEGASFEGRRVRACARGLRLVSEASSRFERGVDPHGIPHALDRCVELLIESCPGAKLAHSFDSFPAPSTPPGIKLRGVTLRRILGEDIPEEEVRAHLEALGMEVQSESDGVWTVTPPTVRQDVQAEEDLVEEVARLHGYDRFADRSGIPTNIPPVDAPRIDRQRKSRNRLLALGLTEVLTPALVDGDQEESAIGNPGDLLGRPVPVRNPISSDRGHLRGSLVPSLLRVLASNQAHSLRDLAVFEVGRVFRLTAAGEIVESLHAGLLLSGQGLAGTVARSGKWCDFFDLKGILEVYLEAFGTVAVESGAAPGGFFHADRSALVSVDGQGVGAIGEAGAEARRVFDIPPDAPVFVAEVDVDRVGCARQEIAEFRALPRYPGVERDLAVVVSAACRHAQVEEVIRSAAGELLVGVSLFDVYEGEQIGADLKSLAYNLRFCSLERSLTNDEVDARVERITKRLSEDLDARIRQD